MGPNFSSSDMNAVVEQHQDESDSSAYGSLEPRHQRFVDAYVEGKTAAAAYRLATGNKSKHGRVIAHRWLHDPNVMAAIQERTAIAIHDAGVNMVEVYKHQFAIATVRYSDFTDKDGKKLAPHELSEKADMAVGRFEAEDVSSDGFTGSRYKYYPPDKSKAAEFLRGKTAIAQSINVDARQVHVNSQGGSASDALRAMDDLSKRIAEVAAGIGVSAAHQNGPVLPAAVCDESPRRSSRLDAGEDQGSGGES